MISLNFKMNNIFRYANVAAVLLSILRTAKSLDCFKCRNEGKLVTECDTAIIQHCSDVNPDGMSVCQKVTTKYSETTLIYASCNEVNDYRLDELDTCVATAGNSSSEFIEETVCTCDRDLCNSSPNGDATTLRHFFICFIFLFLRAFVI